MGAEKTTEKCATKKNEEDEQASASV